MSTQYALAGHTENTKKSAGRERSELRLVPSLGSTSGMPWAFKGKVKLVICYETYRFW